MMTRAIGQLMNYPLFDDEVQESIDILVNYAFASFPLKELPINLDPNIKKDITFIIPSIGRPTLKRTLLSLQKLNVKEWKAIVVFDGVEKCEHIVDERISYTRIEKTGILNHAGKVRNYGIQMASTSWIGFVDDDDTLTEDYLDEFHHLSNKYNPDVIVFRMKKETIIPAIGTKRIERQDVGISFCMKKCDIYFNPSDDEDFFLLRSLNEQGKTIVLSEKVCYNVNF